MDKKIEKYYLGLRALADTFPLGSEPWRLISKCAALLTASEEEVTKLIEEWEK